MPPKKKGGGKAAKGKVSSKQVQNAKKKIVEDKTFGLKNKNKSKKVQQYVQQVHKQTDQKMAKYDAERERARQLREQKKEEKRQQELMEKQMFRLAVKAPVLEPGTDPKSVYCPWHKVGQCKRGENCKYSHDPHVNRKGAKLDVYQDRRELAKKKEEETNEGWSEDKLKSVVAQKHKGQKVQSNKICKFFIDAVRDKKYGWFWECPNGETCHYKHALPPGFVIEDKKKKKAEDAVEETPIEVILEEERAKLGGQGTPVTLERFTEWKKQRIQRKQDSEAKAAAERQAQIAAGRAQNLTGRELLSFRPELFKDTEDPGADDFDYASLRKQLLEEEDAAAEASVVNYTEGTKHLDMAIDESLFNDADEDLPSDDDDDDEEDEKKEKEKVEEKVEEAPASNNNNNE